MDSELTDRLRQRARDKRDRELRNAKEKIEAAYQADLDAIDRLHALETYGVDDRAAEVLTATQSLGVRVIEPQQVGPAAATREAIVAQGGQLFTIDHIDLFIRSKYPAASINKTAISSALAKMVGKAIETVKPKAGRSPATYRAIPETGSGEIQTESATSHSNGPSELL